VRTLKYIPFLIVVASVTFHGCTSMLLVKSDWSNNQIVVNGKDNDWDDSMFYIPDTQLTAGVRNDSNYMYIILKSTNRQQASQILGLGLTVWFDPSGGTGKDFGIHFPLGRTEFREFKPQTEQNQGENQGFVEKTPNELEIIGVNKNGPVRLSIADAKGVELQLHRGENSLVYEMRIPLHHSPDHLYAIGAKGVQVGIGFEGGKFERPSGGREGGFRRGEGRGGMPGGMGGDGDGGMEGGEGNRREGERGRISGEKKGVEPPKQIDFWLKATLAKEPQSASTQQ